MIELLFLVVTVFAYSLVYWVRGRLAGGELNAVKLILFMVFNGFFVVPYLDVARYKIFPFIGYRPDILENYPLIGWGSLFMAIIHAGTFPTKDDFRFRSLFKNIVR